MVYLSTTGLEHWQKGLFHIIERKKKKKYL